MKIAINFFSFHQTNRFFDFSEPGINDNPNRLELFVGSFGHGENKNANSYIYELDDFDKSLVANIPLKHGEKIFRCDTDRTRKVQPDMQYLVKINVNNGLIYYNNESEEGGIEFETRGTQLSYLNMISK